VIEISGIIFFIDSLLLANTDHEFVTDYKQDKDAEDDCGTRQVQPALQIKDDFIPPGNILPVHRRLAYACTADR